MRKIEKLRRYKIALLGTAIVGFGGLNGVFVWFVLRQPELLADALRNPVSAVFIFEAFIMVGLGAWLIRLYGFERPGWLAFVLLSLIGGLAFSVPAFLLALMGKAEKLQHATASAGAGHGRVADGVGKA